jgi:arginase
MIKVSLLVGIRTASDHLRQQAERFGVEVIAMARWGQDLRLDIRTPWMA